MSISIIIISYNRCADLLELMQDITALDGKEHLKEVIILNNLSTDDYSAAQNKAAEAGEVHFRYFTAPENLGVSRGRNYASTLASGDIFVYLDDDVNIRDKNFLQNIHGCFANPANSDVGVVSFKVFYTANGEMQVNAFPHKKFALYKNKETFNTYYYTGCAHAIRKLTWQQTGDYPREFFYGMEEYDFSYRALNNGCRIIYCAAVEIYHKESPQGRKPKEVKLRMMWVNKTAIAWKFLPRVYFFSTAVMWSFEYLLKTGFNVKGFFTGWKEILLVPGKYKRTKISKKTLSYLQRVEARLWY